jgi:hypothetical protein
MVTTISENGAHAAAAATDRIPALKSPFDATGRAYLTPLQIVSGLAFVDVASATTTDIGAVASDKVRITGTTTITGLGTVTSGTRRTVRFAAALKLTHNATTLILPGSANITTAANDTADFVSLGSGNWFCVSYDRVAGEREKLSSDRTYYVNHGVGLGSNSNSGLSSDAAGAFATVTYAYKYIRDNIDCNGQKVVIQVADGTWNEYVVCHGPVLGLQAAVSGSGISPETSSGVIIRGNLVSKAACHNSRSDTNPCFSFAQGARVRVEGIKFTNSSATDTIFKVYAGARVEVGQIVVGTGPATTAQIQAADVATIIGVASGDSAGWVEWSGGAGIGVVCEVGTGTVNFSDVRFDGSITFTGHPASAFVNCGEGAYFGTNIAWTGTFTGRKYWVSENAVLSDAGTVNIENIPGSLPGVRTSSTVVAPGTRLTLTTGLPVTVSDVTASTSVYLAPDSDKYVLVRNSVSSGLIRQTIPAAGISLRLNATDHLANTNYDVFTYAISDGTAVIATGPAWTSATARNGAISQVDGTWVNTSSMSLKYDNAAAGTTTSVTAAAGTATYVGTIRTVAAGQTEDSLAKRFVWNMYNRRPRTMRVLETTDTWTYSTAAWQQVRAQTTNQLAFVLGLNEDAVVARALAEASSDTATVRALRTGIALDSVSGITTGCLCATQPVTNAGFEGLTALYSNFCGLGYHYLAWLEWGGGADVQTWRGDAGVDTRVQTGITGEVWA